MHNGPKRTIFVTGEFARYGWRVSKGIVLELDTGGVSVRTPSPPKKVDCEIPR